MSLSVIAWSHTIAGGNNRTVPSAHDGAATLDYNLRFRPPNLIFISFSISSSIKVTNVPWHATRGSTLPSRVSRCPRDAGNQSPVLCNGSDDVTEAHGYSSRCAAFGINDFASFCLKLSINHCDKRACSIATVTMFDSTCSSSLHFVCPARFLHLATTFVLKPSTLWFFRETEANLMSFVRVRVWRDVAKTIDLFYDLPLPRDCTWPKWSSANVKHAASIPSKLVRISLQFFA